MIMTVDAVEPLPLAPHMRSIATGLLKDCGSVPGLLFGMILAEHRIVSLVHTTFHLAIFFITSKTYCTD